MRRRAWAARIVGVLYFLPVLWMLLTAVKSRADALAPLQLVFAPTLEHFRALASASFARNVVNSVGIVGLSVALALGLGLLAAYGFSRLRVPGSERLLFWILALRMMPPLVTIIPLYVVYSRIGLGGSYVGIILAYVAYTLPFAIWMLRGFFDDLPREPEEAAWLDGSSRLRILWRVCLPQLGGSLAATAVIGAVFAWNDFLFAQILTGQDTRTIPIAMLRVLGTDFGTDWGLFAAAGVVYLAPIFAVAWLLQPKLLRGVTFGTIRR